MLVEVLKPFPFSRDGITEEQAIVGVPADIPEHLIRGLERAKYVRQTKALAGAPENKVEPKAENKADTNPEAGTDAKADASGKAEVDATDSKKAEKS